MDMYIEYMKIYEYWRSGLFIELCSRAHRLTTLNNSKATRPFSCMKERPGYITSMTIMPYLVKTVKYLLRTNLPIALKLGMQHWVLENYQDNSNGNSELNFFMAISNLLSGAFIRDNDRMIVHGNYG